MLMTTANLELFAVLMSATFSRDFFNENFEFDFRNETSKIGAIICEQPHPCALSSLLISP